MARTLPPVLLILAATLAGCSGGAGSPPAPDDGAPDAAALGLEATPTTGLVRGVVVDDAIRPVAGAVVSLAGDQAGEATTGDDGAFGFDGLQPGTYILRAHKLGFLDAQASAEVVAGEADPPAVKIQLLADVASLPYNQVQVHEGFIECTTNVVVLCGAPNTLEEQFLCPAMDVCTGPVTNDRFTFTLYYAPDLALVQSELSWQSTQAVSPALTLEMEALNSDPACKQVEDPLAGALLNQSTGESPIYAQVWPDKLQEWTIGGPCGVYHSIFAGDSAAVVGVTLQQRFTAISHEFHGYLPPPGWRFAIDGPAPSPQ